LRTNNRLGKGRWRRYYLPKWIEVMAEFSDLRKHPRRKTLFGGSIYSGDNKWECSIADISQSGARVKCSQMVEVGTIVELKINKFNDIREVEVMWAKDNYWGIRFLVNLDLSRSEVASLFKPVSK
jgi:hypothetical protein